MTNNTAAAASAANHHFRKLTVSETFSRMVSIYIDSAHARLFIKLACLLVIPCSLVGMVIVNYVSHNLFESHDTDDGAAYFVQNWVAIVLITGSRLFFHNCAAIIADAAIAFTVAELYVGRRPAWTSSLNVALRRVHHLFLAGLLIFMGVILGYACLVVGGVLVAVSTSVITPVIVIENRSAFEGLQRSIQLTQGFRWYIFACLAILFLLNSMVTHLLNAIFSGSGTAYSMWFSVWGSLINMIPASLFVPAFAILKTIIYISIRAEKEGLDVDGLSQEIGHDGLLSPDQVFAYQQVSVAADVSSEMDENVALGPL